MNSQTFAGYELVRFWGLGVWARCTLPSIQGCHDVMPSNFLPPQWSADEVFPGWDDTYPAYQGQGGSCGR